MRKVAPGFQQTSGSKEAAASLRRGHIQRLNLRYTQVSRQELRYPPQLTRWGWGSDALGLVVQRVELQSIRSGCCLSLVLWGWRLLSRGQL